MHFLEPILSVLICLAWGRYQYIRGTNRERYQQQADTFIAIKRELREMAWQKN